MLAEHGGHACFAAAACKPCPDGLLTQGTAAAGVELCGTPPGYELLPGVTCHPAVISHLNLPLAFDQGQAGLSYRPAGAVGAVCRTWFVLWGVPQELSR